MRVSGPCRAYLQQRGDCRGRINSLHTRLWGVSGSKALAMHVNMLEDMSGGEQQDAPILFPILFLLMFVSTKALRLQVRCNRFLKSIYCSLMHLFHQLLSTIAEAAVGMLLPHGALHWSTSAIRSALRALAMVCAHSLLTPLLDALACLT